MKSAIYFLLLSANLGAQSTARLDSDLAGLASPAAPIAAIATRVADDILALAEKDAQPSRQTVLDFSVELAKALAGKPAAASKVQAVDAAILEVLQSSGVPSARFHSSIDHFRNALIALDVNRAAAGNAANRLMILAQEVRGPEDIQFRFTSRSVR
jgi:hypothetical protein